jgi:hypothetical protein
MSQLTFKDLKKRVSLESITQQQSRLFERLQNKPFWIWNVEEHKQEDIKTKGECCFNHIIGLPQKDGIDKPLLDYERIIFDSLVTHNNNFNSSGNKHLWIKKATGLGISEFMLRFMAWLCLKDNAYHSMDKTYLRGISKLHTFYNISYQQSNCFLPNNIFFEYILSHIFLQTNRNSFRKKGCH